MLVSCVIVCNEVNLLVGRRLRVDEIEEPYPFLIGVARLTRTDDLPVKN